MKLIILLTLNRVNNCHDKYYDDGSEVMHYNVNVVVIAVDDDDDDDDDEVLRVFQMLKKLITLK